MATNNQIQSAKDLCPICKKNKITSFGWSCKPCYHRLSPQDYNQFLIDNAEEIFKIEKGEMLKRNNIRHFTSNAVLRMKDQGQCKHENYRRVYSTDFIFKMCADCGEVIENSLCSLLITKKLSSNKL